MEQNIARLNKDVPATGSTGTTLTAPLRIVNAEGKAVLVLSADIDGGYIHLRDLEGKLRVTLGCDAYGGFLDIIPRRE